jgi:hypothetical protein
MAKRRTSGIQRRERASSEMLNRRMDAAGAGGANLPDWRLLAIGGVLLVGVVIIALVLVMRGDQDPNQQPDDGNLHVDVGTTCRSPEAPCGPDPYSSIPGTSGPHWDPSGIANWGAYSTPQNASQVIHTREHGGIGIWYDPDALDDAQVAELASYVEGQVSSGISGRYKFILTPWGGNVDLGAAVAVTAWRHLLKLDTFDMDAIRAFADESYLKYAPEPNGGPGPP